MRSLRAKRGSSRSNYGGKVLTFGCSSNPIYSYVNVCNLEQDGGSRGTGYGDLEERCLVKKGEDNADGALDGGSFSWTRRGAWYLVSGKEDKGSCLEVLGERTKRKSVWSVQRRPLKWRGGAGVLLILFLRRGTGEVGC